MHEVLVPGRPQQKGTRILRWCVEAAACRDFLDAWKGASRDVMKRVALWEHSAARVQRALSGHFSISYKGTGRIRSVQASVRQLINTYQSTSHCIFIRMHVI
jgi:hypothetical protein